ncbi:MAG TPA: hypothetical protein VEH58_04930 [Dehalococcoidales bacterium]|nr:hypothetical protein [Dehalococcoidales bacterium]
MESSNKRLQNVKNKLRDFIANQGIILFFAVLIVIVGAIVPRILTYQNIISIFTNASLLGIIAIGMTFVIIGGNFDISVGSFISFGNILPLNITIDESTMIKEYLVAEDWDLNTAVPSKTKLRSLRLEDVITELNIAEP